MSVLENIGLGDCLQPNRNKLKERYLKYRHYYANLDMSGFGEYGRDIYAPLLPLFDQWFEKRSLDDIPKITPLLGYNVDLNQYPGLRRETGEVISFHIRVIALSLDGVILDENRDIVTKPFLEDVISEVGKYTRSYDFSDRLCFSITVRMFVEMLKNKFSHLGRPFIELSLYDFAMAGTLDPKPREEVIIPW